MSTTGRTKDPLGPVDFIVTRAFSLFCVVLLLWSIGSVVSAFDGGHPSMTLGAWNDPHPCLQVPQKGWYILGGWAIVNLTGGVLRAIAVSHLVTGYSLISGVLANMTWSWPIVIAGFGVISIGRVMQRTVPMREELEATV